MMLVFVLCSDAKKSKTSGGATRRASARNVGPRCPIDLRKMRARIPGPELGRCPPSPEGEDVVDVGGIGSIEAQPFTGSVRLDRSRRRG